MSAQTLDVNNDVVRQHRMCLGYDFALLGLPGREARVARIRQAAANTAERIRSAELAARETRQSMLAEVATSTYRLLDPRKRRHASERIQLCILSEADLDLQQASRESLFTKVTTPLVLDDERELRLAKAELYKQLRDDETPPRRVPNRIGSMAVGACVALVSLVIAILAIL